MKIRFAVDEDLHEIQRLNKALFDYEHANFDKTFNLDWTMGEHGNAYFSKSIKDENACSIVAIDGDVIIGYLVGWIKKGPIPFRIFTKQAEIDNMYVEEGHRGKSVGKQLIDTFYDWAKKRGVDNIRVVALSGNARAISFYKKCGFIDFETVLERKL
jgi:diamine N-acetyltransferase